jgi:sulfide dehydrogenase cytochrome subunit
MKPFNFAVLAMTLALSGPAVGTDISELLAQCQDCHGPGGVSAHGDVPTIAGQNASFISKTLRSYQVWGRPCIKSEFRYGDTTRPRKDMCQVAEGLTGEEITALGAHFTAQPFKAAAQAFDAGLAERGAALHAEHCEQCHEQGGTVPDRGPILAGQWTPYLRKSLKFVPTGEHLVPPAMESVISGLGPDDIDALMNFYASQQD